MPSYRLYLLIIFNNVPSQFLTGRKREGTFSFPIGIWVGDRFFVYYFKYRRMYIIIPTYAGRITKLRSYHLNDNIAKLFSTAFFLVVKCQRVKLYRQPIGSPCPKIFAGKIRIHELINIRINIITIHI